MSARFDLGCLLHRGKKTEGGFLRDFRVMGQTDLAFPGRQTWSAGRLRVRPLPITIDSRVVTVQNQMGFFFVMPSCAVGVPGEIPPVPWLPKPPVSAWKASRWPHTSNSHRLACYNGSKSEGVFLCHAFVCCGCPPRNSTGNLSSQAARLGVEAVYVYLPAKLP